MKKLATIFLILLLGGAISAGALTIGYKFGKAVQANENSLSPTVKNNQPQALSSQHSMQIPDDALDLYSSYCASCHGVVGEGSTIAPALDDPDLQNRLDASVGIDFVGCSNKCRCGKR